MEITIDLFEVVGKGHPGLTRTVKNYISSIDQERFRPLGAVVIKILVCGVLRMIDLKGLKDKVSQHSKLDVLNGIAYNGEPNILYVTGKNWDKMFKIKIVEK